MSLIKTIQEKLRVNFNALLTAEEKQALKDYHTKMEADAAAEAAKAAAPQFKEAKTKDGVIVKYEGELKEGTPLTVMVEGVAAPAPDGEHELQDGTIVTVAGGLVTGIKKKEVEPMPGEAEMNKMVEAKFSAQKTELEKLFETKFAAEKQGLIDEVKELKKVQLSTLNVLDKILNMPVDTISIEEGKVQKKYEEMTPAEQVKFNRGKL